MPQREHRAGTSQLLAYLEGDPDDSGITLMATVVDQLIRECANPAADAPLFVNEGTGLDRTVGVLLILPRPSEDLDTERVTLARVEARIAVLETATTGTDHVVALELDGEVVGWIEDGQQDRSLLDGLLIPWRQHLGGPA